MTHHPTDAEELRTDLQEATELVNRVHELLDLESLDEEAREALAALAVAVRHASVNARSAEQSAKLAVHHARLGLA